MARGGILDCVVVGAGPAGLTAAIYLGRFRRDFAVIDNGASRCAWIPRSHNHPGFPEGIGGRTLLSRMRRQAERYGAQVTSGAVAGLSAGRGGFRLATSSGPLRARKVILATGVLDNAPPLPGLEDAVARGLIRICPICDGYEVIGRRLAVLGRDDHGGAEALFLKTYAQDIALIHVAEPQAISAPMRRRLAKAGVEILETPLQSVVLEKRRIAALGFGHNAPPRRFEAVYSALGVTPRTNLAVQAGARLDESGRLYVGEHQETSVPGLYAAGDVVRGLNQISTAEGEAAIAATDVHNALSQGR
jgi:thioredoxin reductase (NADPH)